MPTRKDDSIRSLTKTGGKSLGITFPIDIIRRFGWKERQKLVVTSKGKSLIIKDWKK
jgi:bifunctional DNA-binding transcriptional regulator/antitoxin component of YhaV-PrlF toxin-antitoxin module